MLRSSRRILISFFCLLALGLAGQAAPSYARSGENRAGLVVQFPDGTTNTYCLSFEGETITGLDLLLKSGLEVKVEVQGLGALVCQIGPTGCDYPAQPCVCQSYGPGGAYWSYHHLKDGRWRTSAQGAGIYKVSPGDVEGWAWSGGTPPPVYTFNQLCPASRPPTKPPAPPVPPTNTPPPTGTPVPPPPATDTPQPPDPTSTTVIERLPTNTLEPTGTPQPAPQEPQATPTSTPTEAIPTGTPASTATPPATATTTPTASPSPTLPPTNTPIPTPTLTPALTASPQSPPANPEDTARTVAFLIAGGVLGSLAVWAGLTFFRGRGSPGSHRGAP